MSHLIFMFVFFVGMICSALKKDDLQLWPGHWKSLLSVDPWLGGHVGSLRTFRQRQLGGEAFHAALPAKVSHLSHQCHMEVKKIFNGTKIYRDVWR